MIRTTIRISKDLHEKLRKESFDTNKSINEIVSKLIENKYKGENGMLKLVEKDHSEETILKEGTFEQILKYLKENENLINWVHDEDDTIVLPKLNEVEDVEDLKCELEKIDLSWWSLEIEEI